MIKIYESDSLMGMANVRGIYVKNPGKLPFSFYFSSGTGQKHSIRVKPVFNPNRLYMSSVGNLKLSGDWEYTPGKDEKFVSDKDIDSMKKFFKDNIVLFAMVWDEQLQDGMLEDYLKGLISFNDMLEDIVFYDEYKKEMEHITTVKELDEFCRNNNLVNFYGN